MDCLLDDGVRFRAVLGNHDVLTDGGRPELDEPAFGMKWRNYVVRRNGVRFVLADSNPLQRDVLRRKLTAEEGDLWTVVAFHHPVFSPGTGHGSTPGYRPGLPRMFRRKGVDLVLNGHDHIYAVTEPLRRIRYVVTGGGGAYLYGCSDAWFSERCVARHHFLYVVVWPDRIGVRAVPIKGKPFDRFSTEGRP
jgi:3',5'-cyclic AMP phosphodiesterase CpdA